MWDVIRSSAGQAVGMIAVAIVLSVIGYYVVLKLRGSIDESPPPSSEMLAKFKEVHAQGNLSDEEYRTIKSKLSAELQDELRETDAAD